MGLSKDEWMEIQRIEQDELKDLQDIEDLKIKNKKIMRGNHMQKLFDDMMSIEDFGNLLNLEEELDKVSTTPSYDEIKNESKVNKTKNMISWLEAKFKPKNEKLFKKVGKVYTTDKRVIKHFKTLYINDKESFKKTNYAHYVKWLKNNTK